MIASRHTEYRHAKTGGFTQDIPDMFNPYLDDPLLERILRRQLPSGEFERVSKDLTRFGERVITEIEELGRQAEILQPRLEQHDAIGRRTDKLICCYEWTKLKKIAAEEGLISIGYDESRDPQVRRLHQIAKLFLFSRSSAALISCPLAMTDGGVKTLTALGLYGTHPLATEVVDHLKSSDAKKAWTCGQWMTEKKGGSDVAGGCDTYAVHETGNTYRLYGYKWFSSAIDADVALTLARVVDAQGNAREGTKGVSLFLLKVRKPDGTLNGIQMIKLKDKFGTKQCPTAELLLEGVVAEKIGEEGRGIAGISNMLNTTRIYNSTGAVTGMRAIISFARAYSTKRVVFGQLQSDWPLHTATIAKMEVEVRGSMHLLFEAARLLGRTEAPNASDRDIQLLRLVTPVLKLYSGKQGVPLVSEGLECFGGLGYLEDAGLPRILRDIQVCPIWEGTTNVLSLDVLRVFYQNRQILEVFGSRVEELLQKANTADERLKKSKDVVRGALQKLQKLSADSLESSLEGESRIDAVARHIAFSIARVYSGALLIEFATSEVANASDAEVAVRWCCEQPMVEFSEEWSENRRIQADRDLVFDHYPGERSKI